MAVGRQKADMCGMEGIIVVWLGFDLKLYFTIVFNLFEDLDMYNCEALVFSFSFKKLLMKLS